MVLLPVGAIFWWLSGFDSRVTGENFREDLIRRLVRCGISLVLAEMALINLWRWRTNSDSSSGLTYLVIALPMGLLWIGCLSEMAAHVFRLLVDPEDKRAFDARKVHRDLDQLALLVKAGRKAEALQLCRALQETGDISLAAAEEVLNRLGVAAESPPSSLPAGPLREAGRLRAAGQWAAAETRLQELLQKNPGNIDAAFLLMRLYAQDQQNPARATAVLDALKKQPHVAASYVEFARRSILEWSQPAPPAEPESAPATDPGLEAVDDLLAGGKVGSAVEILEQNAQKQPPEFAVWLKLAEVQGKRCGNLRRAEKIVQQMQNLGAFSPEQIATARAKLREWRETGTQSS